MISVCHIFPLKWQQQQSNFQCQQQFFLFVINKIDPMVDELALDIKTSDNLQWKQNKILV